METITLFEKGDVPREPQKDEASSYAPMLDKKLARLDFQKTGREIHNLVRGLNPWPVAFTKLREMCIRDSFYPAGLLEKAPGRGRRCAGTSYRAAL